MHLKIWKANIELFYKQKKICGMHFIQLIMK